MSLSCQSGTIDGIAIFVTARLSENEPRPTPNDKMKLIQINWYK